MKKLITWFYDKYCREQQELDSLYIGGLQRDFAQELNPQEVMERAQVCVSFVDSRVCDFIFNEILKEYSESLFNYGETSKARDVLHNNINVVLKVEEKIRSYAHIDKPNEDFDPHEPL